MSRPRKEMVREPEDQITDEPDNSQRNSKGEPVIPSFRPGTSNEPAKVPAPKSVKYIVTAPFVDINDFSLSYKIGDDVSHFDENRLNDMVNRELAKKS